MKFLLVEDEIIQRRLLKDAVSKMGDNHVTECSSGQEALELLKTGHFDLVLMDIHLSDHEMDGIATARVVHEFYGMPVVFLTADESKETLEDAVAAGSFGYILKSGGIARQQSAYQAIIGVARHNYRREQKACKDLVVCVDLDGKIVFMNWLGEKLLNYTEGAWRGKELKQHLAFASAAAWQPCSANLQDKPTLPKEWEMIDSEGKTRVFELETFEISALNTRLGLRFVCRDVTERRELEHKLQQEEQMRAIGQMTAGFVHDLRSPLSTIVIGLDRLPPNIKPAMELSAKRMSEMINSMLKFARGIQETPERIDLYKVIRGSTIDFNLTRHKNVNLEVGSCEDDLFILGNDLDLRRALMNLYKNAEEAILEKNDGQPGAIQVDIAKKELAHNGAAPASFAQIVVSDNGKGMSRETRDRLFTPFFTTKTAATRPEGNGVGLMNVKGAVERCGGFIAVESELGKGTQFTVNLPLAV